MNKEVYVLTIKRDENHQIIVFSWIPIYDFMMEQINSKHEEEKNKYVRRVWRMGGVSDICYPCYEAMRQHENNEKFFTICLLEWRRYSHTTLDHMLGEWNL